MASTKVDLFVVRQNAYPSSLTQKRMVVVENEKLMICLTLSNYVNWKIEEVDHKFERKQSSFINILFYFQF